MQTFFFLERKKNQKRTFGAKLPLCFVAMPRLQADMNQK
jgi:hypothetical protein